MELYGVIFYNDNNKIIRSNNIKKFSLNTGKHVPGKTPYFDTFYKV